MSPSTPPETPLGESVEYAKSVWGLSARSKCEIPLLRRRLGWIRACTCTSATRGRRGALFQLHFEESNVNLVGDGADNLVAGPLQGRACSGMHKDIELRGED